MICLTGYQGRRVGGEELDADLGRVWRKYLGMKARNELMGTCGGTFHLRGKALQGLDSIRGTE